MTIIANWKLFKIAGKPGWASIIPIYSGIVQYNIVTGSGWNILRLLIPIYGLIYAIAFNFKKAKVYGKGTGFGFGLLFFNPIFNVVLAFGNTTYIGVV